MGLSQTTQREGTTEIDPRNNSSSTSGQEENLVRIEIDLLPDEIIENQIMYFLDFKTVMALKRTCKRFEKKIRVVNVGETRMELKPSQIHDNQNELYFATPVNIGDWSSVFGLHVSVQSHDQGWASVGGSYSWGELSFLDGNGKQELNERIKLFVGKPSSKSYRTYNKVVHRGEIKGFETLPHDSQVAIWARSCYSCWECHMGGASIKAILINSE